MLTLEKLKEMEPSFVFARGTRKMEVYLGGKKEYTIRWLAKRGGWHDWAIYYLSVNASWERTESNGSKLCSESTIRDLVACDDEAYQMYRR